MAAVCGPRPTMGAAPRSVSLCPAQRKCLHNVQARLMGVRGLLGPSRDPTWRPRSSTRSVRRQQAAWLWGSPLAVQFFRPMAAGYGLRPRTALGRSFTLRFLTIGEEGSHAGIAGS
jgi:hypothetical protein